MCVYNEILKIRENTCILFILPLLNCSSTANRHALRSLSHAGAGAFEFFDSKTKSKWEGKVQSQLSKAAQPGLTSVAVEWQRYDDDLPPPVQAPSQITALFSGSRQVVYGFVDNCTQVSTLFVMGLELDLFKIVVQRNLSFKTSAMKDHPAM